jgi:uncharacterized membrane protein
MVGYSKIKIMNINQKIRSFFTGAMMGLADLVPGVSGGTIAFFIWCM